MAFLNTLGRVSRHGQRRFRHVFRASAVDGRLDLTDNGLIDLGNASAVTLTVSERASYPGWSRPGCEPCVVASAALADGSLSVFNPGFVEAVFPAGWAANVAPGLYDLRITVTIGPETACILDEPVEIV